MTFPPQNSSHSLSQKFSAAELDAALLEQFGFSSFRPGQREAIQDLLQHGRLLCIQPTGHGKSLLYQLPAVLLEGMTLVVSPLLALMRDQISHLIERFDIPAATLNSDQTEEENDDVMDRAIAGEYKVLFVAPERLDNLMTFNFLLELEVSLLVIDEAHCLSTWGHDFRPSYRRIVDAVKGFSASRKDLRVLALTATADQRTEKDISKLLHAEEKELRVQRQDMDRPNLGLRVQKISGLANKLETLFDLVQEQEGCGLLYCATRDQTEIVAGYLCANGIAVEAYHAGLDPIRKRSLQKDFISGKVKLIAATNALGMGIDKPDIRFIIHVDVPGSITAYYQEVGRAGRDGQPAQGLLLYDPADRDVQDYFIRSAQPSAEDFAAIQAVIEENADSPPNLMSIKSAAGLHPTRVTVVLAELVEQGFIEKKLLKRRQCYVSLGKAGKPDLARYQNQLEVRTRELDSILSYANGDPECLMQALRMALGDKEAKACGRCDQCTPLTSPPLSGTATSAQQWLDNRPVPIAASRYPEMSAGQAVLDSSLQSPIYLDYMRGVAENAELSPQVLSQIRDCLGILRENYRLGNIVMVPSRSWQQRDSFAQWLSEELDLPIVNCVEYLTIPPNAQRDLLNNDQRRENIKGRMTVNDSFEDLVRGGILLVDDYIGSGATLKEAGRVLRKVAGFQAEIAPLALARIRWRLGAKGMI